MKECSLSSADEPVLLQQGIAALHQRRFDEAIRIFGLALAVNPRDLPVWIHLAMTYRACKRFDDERAALLSALELDPFDPMVLLMKGNWFEREGVIGEAAAVYTAALTVADQRKVIELASIAPLLERARRFVRTYQNQYERFVDSKLLEVTKESSTGELVRFQHTLDMHLGRRKRFDSQPTGLYFAQLAAVEFFRAEQFSWVAALEAQTDAIRAECLQALQDEANIHPYLTYGNDQPLQQWAELNRNPKWSAYHLLKDGVRVEPNASRCPATMAALAHIPQPLQVGRTPVAMFSLLKPGTHIPPHVGVSNVRLVAHLPLIVPPNCALRVGGQTHRWEEGRVCVFDDTIEHEAWNRSDQLRAVLIFDVWHPELTGIERQMVSALAQAMDDFNGQHEAMPL